MKTPLELLKDENLDLHQQLAALQKKLDISQAEKHLQNGEQFGSSFAERLVSSVNGLYGQELYSDLDILTESKVIRGHRLVIASRTNYWGDLNEKTEIDFKTGFDIASTILKWIYTDKLEEDKWGVLFLMEVLKVAHRIELNELTKRCENAIITQLEVSNCIKIYEEAGKLRLQRLTNACADFISASWALFEPEHFEDMNSELLFDLLKSHCRYILHATIRLKRPDVMLLYLKEEESSLQRTNPRSR
ncbi:hypothetical protein M3Y97_00361300 [Aphelenchoides bicaudatus]|nr:hypothetical protein M3Y97_00361300 [Aphelenchoides bicaudatus]